MANENTAAEIELMQNAYRDATSEVIKKHVQLLEAKWRLVPTNLVPNPDTLEVAQGLGFDQLLGGVPEQPDTRLLFTAEKEMNKEIERVHAIKYRAKSLRITGHQEEDTGLTLHQRINGLYKQIERGFINLQTQIRHIESVQRPHTLQQEFDVDPDLFHVSSEMYAPGKIEELGPLQRLIYVYLHEFYERRMRRYKGHCCEEIIVDGQRTRAWRVVKSIEDFVWKFADKECRHDVWRDLTHKGGGARTLIDHLEKCVDSQFPEIKKDRHMWSYSNGVFLGKVLDPLTGGYTCKFIPYASREFQKLDPTLVSCKYFDAEFDDYSSLADWYDIPTPHFARILDYQGLPEDVQRWAYVLAGRLCFEVGDLDGWQVIPFYGGIARSGKSQALTSVFKQFYETEDVRTLSNNVERKFGLGSIYDGFMFIAPECRETMALEQAEFQSMVSGEDVSIAVKHEKAKSIQWTAPGVMAGNEMPGWRDTGGSILRRLVTFNFVRQVKEADATLPEKLKCEVPTMLQKCVRAYLDYALHKYRGVGNIWDILPEYFTDVRKEIEEEVSPLDKFLNSTEVIVDPGVCVPLCVFQDAFQFYAKNRCGERHIKFSAAYTRGPFSSRGITVECRTGTYEGRVYENEDFVVGVTIKETSA